MYAKLILLTNHGRIIRKSEPFGLEVGERHIVDSRLATVGGLDERSSLLLRHELLLSTDFHD